MKLNNILRPEISPEPCRLLCFVLVAMLVSGCSIIPRDCRSAVVLPLSPGEKGEVKVDLASKCNRSGILLDESASYWFEAEAIGLLEDGSITCNPPGYKDVGADCYKPLGPEGYLADELPWWRAMFWLAAPFRPMNDKNSRWLEAVGRVVGNDGDYFSLVKHSSGDRAYQPSSTGELLVLANDFPWLGRYTNNRGTLKVTVHRCDRTARKPSPSTQAGTATHYRQQGDAASLRSVAAALKPGMQRNAVVQLLGPPAYSPSDNQDYYPTKLRDKNGFTLVLVVNYHAAGTAEAGTIDWFFLDYIGE